MRSIILTISTILLSCNIVSAQEFNISKLLLSAYDDPLVNNIYEQSNYLRSADMRTPNINEVELRTRSDDLNLSIDDIRFRLTFTNFGEIREGGRYNDLLIKNYELEYLVRIHLALIHRYNMALDLVQIQSEIDLLDQYRSNLEDQLKVEKAQLLGGGGSISRHSELERDISRLSISESELKSQLIILENQMLSFYQFSNGISIDIDSLAGPLEILELVNNNQSPAAHPEIQLKEQDVELGLQETQLEIKENNGNFGYFQAEYDRNPDREITDNLGYQLGFTIPITNEDKADIERSKVSNLKDKQSLDFLVSEHNLKFSIIEKKLTELIDQYSFLEMQYQNQQGKNRILKSKYLEVNSLLTMQENELQYVEALQEHRNEIYATYLEWLDQSGLISGSPARNYLYKGFPEMDN